MRTMVSTDPRARELRQDSPWLSLLTDAERTATIEAFERDNPRGRQKSHQSAAVAVRRDQLEHVLRAASQIIGDPDLLVVGSAAILGTYGEDHLPLAATRSDEADIAPFVDPDGSRSMAIEGGLGSGLLFHETFGYYADGIDLGTAIVPSGWRERLVS
jgi:hypothetical protein